MKNHYLKFGVIYCVLALIIFLAAISFYTKKKIDKINEKVEYYVINGTSVLPDTFEDERRLLERTLSNWNYYGGSENDDIGLYSSIIDVNDGYKVILEAQDIYRVYYSGEFEHEVLENSDEKYVDKVTQTAPGDIRYMFTTEPLHLTVDEQIDLRLAWEVTITGARCDDLFLYGGQLTFPSDKEKRTADIATPSVVNEAESIPYEEWIVRLDRIEPSCIIGNSKKNELYDKAKNMSEAYVNSYKNGDASSDLKVSKGIFITTVSAIKVINDGEYLVPFYVVKMPLKIAFRDNINVYVLSLLALIIVEAVIIYAVRKLYLDQKAFELRSRKLTKGIASDLKGPLSATKTYVENWENVDEAKRLEYSEKIMSEVDHMSGMVTKLLELSKINGGNIKLNREDVDLLLLTKNIRNINHNSILEKKIDLTIKTDDNTETYPVNADLEMMHIVINNFMTNAIKYCDHTITVKLIRTSKRVEFNITNDGAKIEDSDTNKVWDPLYSSQKNNDTEEAAGGVGLSIVKSILEAHRARYGCYSDAKGTTFWFSMDAYDKASSESEI